jgi:hypothetical protein
MIVATIDEFLNSLRPCNALIEVDRWDSARFFIDQLATQSYQATTQRQPNDHPMLHIRLDGDVMFARGEVYGDNCIAVTVRVDDVNCYIILQRPVDEDKSINLTHGVKLHARKLDWEVVATAMTELYTPLDADIPMIAKLLTDPAFKPQEA